MRSVSRPCFNKSKSRSSARNRHSLSSLRLFLKQSSADRFPHLRCAISRRTAGALLLFFAAASGSLRAAPLDDLVSPSQEVRDAAAKVLRETYVAPPVDRLKPLLDSIKIGERRSQLLQQLRPFNVPIELPPQQAAGSVTTYRLDDRWVLQCVFMNEVLRDRSLLEDVRDVSVEPPAKYTGVWTTYYVNGQPSREIHYKDGAYSGTVTSFHAVGSKSRVENFGPRGHEGEEIGYFPSGAVAYRGNYESGSKVGKWTWYNEDGTVRSVQEQPSL